MDRKAAWTSVPPHAYCGDDGASFGFYPLIYDVLMCLNVPLYHPPPPPSPTCCKFDLLPSLGCLSSLLLFSDSSTRIATFHVTTSSSAALFPPALTRYHQRCLVVFCSPIDDYTRSETPITDFQYSSHLALHLSLHVDCGRSGLGVVRTA